MRPLTIPFLLGIFAFLCLGTYLINGLPCNTTGSAIPTFSVMDGDFSTSKVSSFSFLPNSAKASIGDALTPELQKIATYLTENPERALVLTGLYSTTESNDTDFENLGMARAQNIKSSLVAMDAPAGQISTQSAASNIDRSQDKTIYGNVDFLFTALSEAGSGGMNSSDAGGSSSGELSITDGMTILYTGDNLKGDALDAVISDRVKLFAEMAMNYITANDGAQLMVTAHTDNEGSESANQRISEAVAQQVRRYFRNNGFASKQVEWKGMGDTDPVASNMDEEGRAENRRIVLTVE